MERKILQDFIEIYHAEYSLWKIKSSHYNNKIIKNAAYRRLLYKLRELYPEADIDMVKKKINALRTNFRKEQRKVEASKQRSAVTGEPVYEPSLWYYELFYFIADQEGDNNKSVVKAEPDENAYFDEEDSDEIFEEEFQDSSPDSVKPLDTIHHSSQSMSMNNQRAFVPTDYADFKRKRDVNYNPDSNWYSRQEHTSTYVPPAPISDGYEIFGRYVASKLKKMDKPMQMLSERLISEILFRGQVKSLSENTNISDGHKKITTKEESIENSCENL